MYSDNGCTYYVTGEMQGRVSSLTEQERVSREQCIMLRSTVSALESRLSAATKEAAQYKTNLELQQAQCNQLKQAKEKYVQVTKCICERAKGNKGDGWNLV